jgi:hypothetical protein
MKLGCISAWFVGVGLAMLSVGCGDGGSSGTTVPPPWISTETPGLGPPDSTAVRINNSLGMERRRRGNAGEWGDSTESPATRECLLVF